MGKYGKEYIGNIRDMSIEENNREKQPKKPAKKKWKVLLINLSLMAALVLIVIWVTLAWLQRYTRHNDIVQVPDIIGMSVDEAATLLAQSNLYINVTDSVYDEKATPGAIVETVPKVHSKIKRERAIYVVINTVSVMKRIVPEIREISMRQALATLQAIGFTQITVQYVGGSHNDLALYLRTQDGRTVSPGEKLPFNTPLVLVVSSNDPMLMILNDNQAQPELMDESEDENWF